MQCDRCLSAQYPVALDVGFQTELGHRPHILVGRETTTVVFGAPLHEGDALPLDRVGDDRDRSPVTPRRLVERTQDVDHVVAVHLDDAPSEGRPLGDQLARDLRWEASVGAVARPAVLLQLVVVDDRDQVVEAVAGRRHGGLPDLALLALAVAEHHVRPHVEAAEARPEGHPHGGRDAHAERPAGHVEPGQAGHVGVALEARAGRVERLQLLDREVAAQRHRRVEPDGGMALREHEPVAIGPGRLVGTDAQDAEVESGQQVGRRERAPEVAGPGVIDGPHDREADLAGHLLEAGDLGGVGQGGRGGDRPAHEAPFFS